MLFVQGKYVSVDGRQCLFSSALFCTSIVLGSHLFFGDFDMHKPYTRTAFLCAML